MNYKWENPILSFKDSYKTQFIFKVFQRISMDLSGLLPPNL